MLTQGLKLGLNIIMGFFPSKQIWFSWTVFLNRDERGSCTQSAVTVSSHVTFFSGPFLLKSWIKGMAKLLCASELLDFPPMWFHQLFSVKQLGHLSVGVLSPVNDQSIKPILKQNWESQTLRSHNKQGLVLSASLYQASNSTACINSWLDNQKLKAIFLGLCWTMVEMHPSCI